MSFSKEAHDAESSSAPQPVNLAHLPALVQATGGAIGSVVSNALVYPLDLVTTRMQTRSLKPKTNARPDISRQQSMASQASVSSVSFAIPRTKNYRTLLSSFRSILLTEPNGIQAFYNGILVDSAATLINSFLYFYVYTTLNKAAAAYKKRRAKKIGPVEATMEELVIGALAGMLSKFCTCPLSNITVRLQTPRRRRKGTTATPGHTPYPEKQAFLLAYGYVLPDPNTSSEEDTEDEDEDSSSSYLSQLLDTVGEIYEERGYGGFWSGYGNNCVLTLNPSLTLYLIKLLQHGKRSPGFWATFLHSAIASSFSTMLAYPLMLSKTLIQANSHSRQSMLGYRKRVFGYKALYTGLQAQLLKGFIGQGITMSVKGQVEKLIVFLYMRRRRRALD